MLLYMEHTFEYRMRPNTTQEAAFSLCSRHYASSIMMRSKPCHHTRPRNVVAGVGSMTRNRSQHGCICTPTAALWPTVMSTRQSTFCRPGRGLGGVLHEYATRSCGAAAPAECSHILCCHRPTSASGGRAGQGFWEGPVCCRCAPSRHAVGESPAQSLSPPWPLLTNTVGYMGLRDCGWWMLLSCPTSPAPTPMPPRS